MSKTRKQKTSRKSGGIGIFVKNTHIANLHCIDSDSEYVQWFKMSKDLMNTDDDVFFGVVYIPPDRTKYFSTDLYDSCMQEIEAFTSRHKYVVLMGDFNSRSSTLPDIIELDNTIYEEIDINPLEVAADDLCQILLDAGMLVHRSSQDSVTNTLGVKLVDFCKSNGLVILNGRAFNDKSVGKYTCKNTSVIDYVISSVHSCRLFSSFAVNEFCPLMSDIHCALTFSLDFSVNNSIEKPLEDEKIKPWSNEKRQTFVDNLDRAEIEKVNNLLCSLDHSDVCLNDAVNKIADIFTNAAKSTFGSFTQNQRPNKSKHRKQKWFDINCKTRRHEFHLKKKQYCNCKTAANKNEMLLASKQYKKTIRVAINKYKHNFKKELRNMRSKSPKDYWKYVNSLNKKSTSTDLDINEFYDFFKKLNANDDDNEVPDPDFPNIQLTNDLDIAITPDEVMKAIKNLKNNKSCGLDNIINEYIKSSTELLLPIYVRLFNKILNSGIIPDPWLTGKIVPIYKNKGDSKNPENYRPITILSCLGKLFTAIINARLTIYIEENDLLNKNQAGFRKGHSTIDNIFILHLLSEYCKHKHTKLFCSFIDFTKAFDNIWRSALWSKILKYNINGKVFNVIKNMYKNIKSCVNVNNQNSAFFQCCRGVRQGENLSPILFSLFLNDLEHYILSNNDANITLSDLDLDVFLKIVVLLYADDTVLFATSEENLKSLLKTFIDYCNIWQLNINVDKTKVMVFGDRAKRKRNIVVYDSTFEVVDSFKYLGVFFSKNRKFVDAKKHACEQAKKALFCLYTKIRNLNIPIDCQLKLFDNTVLPILLYACEIWGTGDLSLIEKIHTDFLKRVLNVKKSTPHAMVYGELGRFPLSITVKKRIIGFWYKLITNHYNMSSVMYMIAVNDSTNNSITYSWLDSVKNILIECGLGHIWEQQYFDGSREYLLALVENALKETFTQKWKNDLNVSAKCVNYRLFKTQHEYESYLNILPTSYVKYMIDFRLCNNRLPVETGRWAGVERNERKCVLCDRNDVGDEFHYLLSCSFFATDRKCIIQHNHRNSANVLMFQNIMTEKEENKLVKLSKFIGKILKTFKDPPG